MLSSEGDLQPVGAAFLQNERSGLEITDFAIVDERVHDVTARPVLELQPELSGHDLHLVNGRQPAAASAQPVRNVA